MATFTASTFISKGSLWLYLDNQLILQNNDMVSMELEEGVEYIVHWFVMGSPNASYSITISSPKEAEFQLTKVVGVAKKDFGFFGFIKQ